jgi:UDP-glucose 4-epimerase
MLEGCRTNHSIRSVRYRYFNVSGAWPDGSMGEAHDPETHIVPRILRALRDGQQRFEVFGGDYPTPDGTCVRDYIHVLDLADAHRIGLEALVGGHEGGVFNLGNGQGFSNLQVVETCAAVADRPITVDIGPRRAGDPAVLVASAQKAEQVLGWRPRRPELAEMVGDAWRWHCANPAGYSE